MGKVLIPSDRCAVAGVIDPDALTATTHDSGWIAMKDFEKLMAVIQWGTLGTNATINAKLQMAKDDQGTLAEDITGKAITEVSQADSPDPSNGQAIINFTGEELDVNDGFTHVRLRVTVGTATSDGGAVILGFNSRYAPASDNDLSSVAEIIY